MEIDYKNPLIERDMNRCVLCGKCARICDEIVSFGALTFISRGIETKIGCEFDEALNCEFCGSCVSVCPVGSLLARPFKFKARFWSLTRSQIGLRLLRYRLQPDTGGQGQQGPDHAL